MFVIKNFDPQAISDYTAYECKSYRVRHDRQANLYPGGGDDWVAAQIFLDESETNSVHDPVRVITVKDGGRAFIENSQGKTIDTVRSYLRATMMAAA